MKEYVENNKNSNATSDKLSVIKLKDSSSLFFHITLDIYACLIFTFILSIGIRILEEGYMIIIYLYPILLGLSIGKVVYYRVMESRYINKKIIFTLIVLHSLLIYLLSNFFVFFNIYFLDFFRFLSNKGLVYNSFVIISIGYAIFYGVKGRRYGNKKINFILIALWTFLAYSIFNFIVYLFTTPENNTDIFLKFLRNLWFKTTYEPFTEYIIPYELQELTINILYYIPIAYSITGIIRVINIIFWVGQVFITIYIAWSFVIYTWLLHRNRQSRIKE
ncbi:MAG: hypothetical protein ABRQ39_31085 [Candidatus Eremiobacterota bacterium]